MTRPASPSGFFAARWHGHTPLDTLLWRDMLVVGTLLNLLASFAALALIAADGHPALAVALHLAPLPYNTFLFAALLRRADPGTLPSLLGALWFVLVLVL